MKGLAEIAGGGVSGLACAMMLARPGWTVRVHERGQEIREGGTGLYIKNNAAEVLEEYGLLQDLLPHGSRLLARNAWTRPVTSCRSGRSRAKRAFTCSFAKR